MGGVRRNTKKKYKSKKPENKTTQLPVKTYTKPTNTNEEKEVKETKANESKNYSKPTVKEKVYPNQSKVNSNKSTTKTKSRVQAPKPNNNPNNKKWVAPNPKTEKVSSETEPRKETDVDKIVNLIKDIIKVTVDVPYCNYSIIEGKNKRSSGIMTMNCIISKKKVPDNKKTLLFSIDMNKKTEEIHIVIIDGHVYKPSILFVASGTVNEIKSKIEKYVPSIVLTTQEMIK